MASNSASSVRFGFPAWFVNLVATVQVGAAMRLALGTLVRIHLTTSRELRVQDIPEFDVLHGIKGFDDFAKLHDTFRSLLMSGTITASDRFIDVNGLSCSVKYVVPPASQNCSHPANHYLVFISDWRY